MTATCPRCHGPALPSPGSPQGATRCRDARCYWTHLLTLALRGA